MGRLFLLFTIVPLVELYLLTRLSGWIGFGYTLLIVLLTGVGGASLARSQGARVLEEWQGAMHTGTMPAEGVLGGVLVLVGGVLLVTPGVLTDLLGFSLLVPVTRALWAVVLRRWLEARVADGSVHVAQGGFGPPGPPRDAPRPPPGPGPRPQPRRERPPPGVIDVDGEEL